MKILNAILFKLNWIACVVGGPLWGAATLTAFTAFSVYARTWRDDLVLVFGLVLIGAVLDTTWIHVGLLDYGTSLAPVWIIQLWAGLAFTIHHAMAIFKEKPLLGAVLSGLAAPVTYLSGESLGAVTVPHVEGLAVIGIVWFVLFFGIFRINQPTQSADQIERAG